ncbi:adrenocortical dysplasia protein homolog [Myripristis murdjan]|uniref:adrenocortical dysplasia protein homolog n=1 Tax=Myripristis murdjan TaxID=586833 RepID=UPI001175FC87|nr:uncharacterized protein LOC115360141 [Myripristis murdjan]
MVQTNRNKLEPWIEKMILSHGSEQISSTVWLKAHVIGVGQMSQSQAQGSDGPTGLLFLSDGKVQIPAVLTKSAWEHLQEQEDRECFSSLVNTTVCLQAYRMQFHMALEETRCRFFLSIDKLATAATGPEKDNTPCCTTLPSVRYKICKTWESLLSHDLLDSQKSQCEFDLSDLLGEWQHNCVQDVLQDIRERLRPEWRSSPQPSTSSCIPSLVQTDTCTATATSWDADRVKYKGEEHFSVPVTWLLIPDEEAQEPQKPFSEGSKTPGRLFVDSEDKKTGSSLACKHTETVDPCVDDFESRTARPAAFKEIPHSTKNTPLHEDSILREDIVIDCDVRILSNPWDIFPPPCDALNSSSSCSESITSEVMPLKSLPDSTATKSKPESAVMVTSTQRPISGSGSPQMSEQNKAEQSLLPPYQKPQSSSSFATISGSSSSSASVSLLEPIIIPLNPSGGVEIRHFHTTQQSSRQEEPVVQKDVGMEKDAQRIGRKVKAKRKRNEPMQDALTVLEEEGTEEEDARVAQSPPSWLFETQALSKAHAPGSSSQGKAARTVLRKIPTVHSDGTQFSYSYQVSGQSLQDMSKFEVTDGLLHWAVKYLLAPKQTDRPHKIVS